MGERNIKELVGKMTREEKASLCIGGDFWHTQAIERLGIPSVMLTDGPFGLRKQAGGADHLGLNESNVAIAFPAGVTLASSYSPDLAYEVGEELGKICQMEDVGVILGPAMNIKRSPLCGRSFEYYSEDPVVSSRLASGMIRGIQSRHVGACPKHFLANNQEHYRQTSNSVVDERALREIYLASFEEAVKEAKPWTIMCSYNRINGTYACENKALLTDVLRGEWGFDGYVMTDWGALDEPVDSLLAGLNLAMPGTNPDIIARIVQAMESGELDEAVVDRAAGEFLTVLFRYVDRHDKNAVYDFEAGHRAAKKAAEESAVLLKNEGQILPLACGESVLFIGEYAKNPRYQGGGSSHIHPYRVTNALEQVPADARVCFAQGYEESADADRDEELLQETLRAAALADKAVIFAGLPETYETEGLDRKHMRLPDNQNRLIAAVAGAQKNTVVVLHNGAPVEMPWLSDVKAVLEVYLGGEAVGEATADLLYGIANPSGRLAETFPVRLEDNPTYPYYGVEREDVVYREGILVGYRYYETMKREVLFPFGHGLSYTSFAYRNLRLSQKQMKDTDTLEVLVTVKNTGARAGAETVQLYVAGRGEEAVRPVRELKEFRKVFLSQGEEKTVSFALSKRAFAYWNTAIHDWYVPTGAYEIQIGKSVSEIVLTESVQVMSTTEVKPVFTLNSAIGDMMKAPAAAEVLGSVMQAMRSDEGRAAGGAAASGALSEEAVEVTGMAMPLRALLSFSDKVTKERLEQLLEAVNAAVSEK